MTKTKFVTKIIPNGNCSHKPYERLLIMVPHDVAHELNAFKGKQIKVTVECI